MHRSPSRVQALTFDIGGTVFDWLTAVENKLEQVASYRESGVIAADFARAWRAGFLECYEAVYRQERPWMDAQEICDLVLRDLLEKDPSLTPDEKERAALSKAWHEMPAWEDVRPAIKRLRQCYLVAPFTILTWSMAAGSSKFSGIDWDGILSCDLLGVYKPHPKSYARVLEVLRRRPDEVMLVASHPSDLLAARQAGLRTAYVLPKLEDPGEDYRDRGFAETFDLIATDFADLADRLLDEAEPLPRVERGGQMP